MKQINLMYHDVYRNSLHESGFDTNGANYYKITENRFIEQLEFLSSFVSDNKLRKENVVLTFDDGGISFSEVIVPLLDKYGFKGHFYISTDYIGTKGFMSSDDIKRIADRGHTVGSHSCSHPSNLGSLSKEERDKEWRNSVSTLNSICGMQTNEVSIPNGYFTKEDVAQFKRLGINTIYTSTIEEYKVVDGVSVVGRIAIDANTTQDDFRQLVEGGWLIKKRIVRQTLLQVLKSLLGNNYISIKKTIRKWIH